MTYSFFETWVPNNYINIIYIIVIAVIGVTETVFGGCILICNSTIFVIIVSGLVGLKRLLST